ALHLVDQRGDEGAGGADQVREILLRDAAQVVLAAVRAALAEGVGQDEEGVGQAGGNLLEGQSEHPLAHGAVALVERADDVQGEVGAALEELLEGVVVDAPDLGLSGRDRELVQDGALGPEEIAEEIAGPEDAEHGPGSGRSRADQTDPAPAADVDLVGRIARTVDDGLGGVGLDLEITAVLAGVGRGFREALGTAPGGRGVVRRYGTGELLHDATSMDGNGGSHFRDRASLTHEWGSD